MAPKKPGRPKKAESEKQTHSLLLRFTESEKDSIQLCADLAGVSLSSWIRERLRFSAIRELEAVGRPIPFLKNLQLD